MYGFMKIQTLDGFKRIDRIDRGDLILTNDGYQPVALIDICRYPHKLINNNIIESPIIKIPKHFFACLYSPISPTKVIQTRGKEFFPLCSDLNISRSIGAVPGKPLSCTFEAPATAKKLLFIGEKLIAPI